MSRSTFSGPVQVGVDDAAYLDSAAGTAKIGPNWGFAKMAQSAPITQTTSSTFPTSTTVMGMVIPALSTITRISVLVTTAWTNTVDIGQAYQTDADGVPDSFNLDILVNDWVLTAVGLNVVGPGDTDNLSGTDNIQNWMNNSDSDATAGAAFKGIDRCIAMRTNVGGPAVVGILTVEYSQAVDLSAIA